MAISKNREKPARRPVVRTRRAGTPVQDNRIPESYDDDITLPDSSAQRDVIEVEVDSSGNVTGDPFAGQGT